MPARPYGLCIKYPHEGTVAIETMKICVKRTNLKVEITPILYDEKEDEKEDDTNPEDVETRVWDYLYPDGKPRNLGPEAIKKIPREALKIVFRTAQTVPVQYIVGKEAFINQISGLAERLKNTPIGTKLTIT